MRDEMDRVFEQFATDWAHWSRRFRPRRFGGDGALTVPDLDARENTHSVVDEAELQGVDEKDISVTLANGVLTIKGEKKQEKEEKGENYHVMERSFGSFEHSISLPDTVDETKIEARFGKGVLKVTAAKKPEAIRAERKTEISKA
jgi:HSP20 family protein